MAAGIASRYKTGPRLDTYRYPLTSWMRRWKSSRLHRMWQRHSRRREQHTGCARFERSEVGEPTTVQFLGECVQRLRQPNLGSKPRLPARRRDFVGTQAMDARRLPREAAFTAMEALLAVAWPSLNAANRRYDRKRVDQAEEQDRWLHNLKSKFETSAGEIAPPSVPSAAASHTAWPQKSELQVKQIAAKFGDEAANDKSNDEPTLPSAAPSIPAQPSVSETPYPPSLVELTDDEFEEEKAKWQRRWRTYVRTKPPSVLIESGSLEHEPFDDGRIMRCKHWPSMPSNPEDRRSARLQSG